jgi:signal transduction histidine kinase
MARLSVTGGRGGKAKARRASQAKGRKTTKTSPNDKRRRNPAWETEVARLKHELKEALAQQTATSEVLKVISSSTGDLQPVFDQMLEKATGVCGAEFGLMGLFDGDMYRRVASYNVPEAFEAATPRERRPDPDTPTGIVGQTGQVVRIDDLSHSELYLARRSPVVAMVEAAGARTLVVVPMLRDARTIGAISIYRKEVRPFSDRQVELLKNFASQAVIAIENTRLFNETKEALEQQTATADVLKVISSSRGELEPVFQEMLSNAMRICEAKFGLLLEYSSRAFKALSSFNLPSAFADFHKEAHVWGAETGLGKLAATRKTVHVRDAREGRAFREQDAGRLAAVELGGVRTFVAVPMMDQEELIGAFVIFRQEVRPFTTKQIALVENFTKQAVIAIENTRLLRELRERTDALSRSLDDLRAAQDRLVQTEKLASLGQLTAGIAHEIKNPLNFVNNFSEMSAELIGELRDVVGDLSVDADKHADIKEITDMLSANLEKIVQHGKRADAIVKSMLLHSGQSSGEHRPSDINALVDECLNRAYYGERAETRGFVIKLERSFDPDVGEVDLFPREISRAVLNLISNGFYATSKRKEAEGDGYEPVLVAATRNLGNRVEIRIRDNGAGIPVGVKEKMFEPFFTTKPAGEGTGLGLSITHDIVVKQHGGSIEVDTRPGEFAEIRLILPRTGERT